MNNETFSNNVLIKTKYDPVAQMISFDNVNFYDMI